MCGIVGVVSKRPLTNRDWLGKGVAALRHRGPDDHGEWWSARGDVGLGHRRLAIQDLTKAAHQPMVDADEELAVTFNGEIYNFREIRQVLTSHGMRFHSESDTEVVLQAYRFWGRSCVEHFVGMFALAIYDSNRRQLFLARDRLGEKPLFYRADEMGLRFGSELKAIVADETLPRVIDRTSLDCFLAIGFVPGSLCMLEGFRKIPPAHALVFDQNTGLTESWAYWKEPHKPGSDSGVQSENQLLEELETLLDQSVRLQLAADVPVGVLLSGGVDSSLITALAARHTTQLKTFTVSFPGHARHDEADHARAVAAYFGTNHSELIARPASVDLLPEIAWHVDEPIIDSSLIPTALVSEMVVESCTVALGGDGGDELFAGYGHYGRLLRLNRRINQLPRSAMMCTSAAATHLLPLGFKGRNWAQTLAVDFKTGVPVSATYFDRASRRRLLTELSSGVDAFEVVRSQRTPSTPDLLQRITRWDLTNYLPEDILVKVDRASMRSSLEVRAPFLDHRVVEFAFGRVPSNLKATPKQLKILPKRLATSIMGNAIDVNRKQGFSIPLGEWLQEGPFLEFFKEVLYDESSVFSQRVVAGMLRNGRRRRANRERLFGLVLFELWRENLRAST